MQGTLSHNISPPVTLLFWLNDALLALFQAHLNAAEDQLNKVDGVTEMHGAFYRVAAEFNKVRAVGYGDALMERLNESTVR